MWIHAGSLASNQFNHVRPGDTIWLVTVRHDPAIRNSNRRDRVTCQVEAAAELGCDPGTLSPTTHHIIAKPGTVMPIYDQDIHHLAGRLRFKSDAGNDRLTLTPNGLVNAQQLQTMRWLWPEAAGMLAEEVGITT